MNTLTVTVVHAQPDAVQRHMLVLAAGARLSDALAAAGVDVGGSVDAGIWGKPIALDTPLAEGDRVELYRPLIADPKAARKKRATEQGYRWQGRTRRAVRGALPPSDD